MRLSRNLRKRREAAGLSQAQLAEKLGVAPSTIAGWEDESDDGHGVRVARLPQIAKVLKCTVEDLVAA